MALFKFLCSKYFGKGAQPFDFIKCNVICKSAYKFRYITEINGGLLLLYGNWRIKFFWNNWLDCEQYGKKQYKTSKFDWMPDNIRTDKIILAAIWSC